MADNVVLNSGSGGETLATDDIAGVQHQRVKMQYGEDGSATDVSDTNPLPIDDAGGSLTVDGTVAVSSVSGTVTVDGSGVTQPVSAASLPLPTGAATAANQTTANSSLSTIAGDTTSIDGKITACDTGSVTVASSALPTGAATAANQSTANGHLSSLAGCVSGTELQVDIVSGGSSGTQYTEADTDATITGTAIMWEDAADTLRAVSASKPLPVDGSNVTQPVSGTVTANAGTNLNTSALALESGGNLDTIAGDTTSLDGKVTACDTGNVTVAASALPTGAATAANQSTANSSLSTIAGDTTSLDGKIAADTTDDLDTGVGTDTVKTAGIALAASGGHTVLAGVDANAAGLNGIPVVLFDAVNASPLGGSGNALTVTGTVSAGAQCSGDVSHDGVDSGAPVKIGGKAYTSEPSAVANADRVNAYFDTNGYLHIKAHGDVNHDAADTGYPVKIGGFGSATAPTAVGANDRVNAWFDLNGRQAIFDGGQTISVDDGSGSLTVDGTVAATQSGTWNITNVSGTVSLPTGAATETTLDAVKTAVETIDNAISGTEMQVDVVSSALPTGAATAANQSTGNSSLSTIAGAVSGTEMQVDVVAPLPAGTNAIGKLAANSGVDIGDVDVTSLPDAIEGPGSPTIDSYSTAVIDLAAATANQSVISAPGASKQIWVYGVVLTAAAAASVTFQDEDDTALSGTITVAENGGFTLPPSGNFAMPWIKVATNKALEVDTTGAGGTVDGIITYAIVSV